MRIKKTLTSRDVLISTGGMRLTVAELIGRGPERQSNAQRSGGLSVVRAAFAASLLRADGSGSAIPDFKGEIQVRVQTEVLRIAGRFRKALRWKEDRVKIPLKDVVHARIQGSQVELWLRGPRENRLQRLALELFTPEAAGELVDWLPDATPFPQTPPSAPETSPPGDPPTLPAARGLWVAVAGGSLVLALMLMVLLMRRGY